MSLAVKIPPAIRIHIPAGEDRDADEAHILLRALEIDCECPVEISDKLKSAQDAYGENELWDSLTPEYRFLLLVFSHKHCQHVEEKWEVFADSDDTFTLELWEEMLRKYHKEEYEEPPLDRKYTKAVTQRSLAHVYSQRDERGLALRHPGDFNVNHADCLSTLTSFRKGYGVFRGEEAPELEDDEWDDQLLDDAADRAASRICRWSERKREK